MMRDLYDPDPAVMGVDFVIQVNMGPICRQNVPWSMFIHFRPCKVFQKRLVYSRIVYLKFFNMFDFVCVELQHFTDDFVHCF